MRNDGSCCTRETESISVPAALLHINVGKLQVKCFTWYQGWTEGEKQMSVLVMQNVLLLFSVLFFSIFFPSQKHLGQLLWSSIFQRGPIRFSVLQCPIRLSLLASSPQDWIQLLPLWLVPVLHRVVLRHGENWSVYWLFFLFFPKSANNMLT